ncbi:MFS transporter [Streptomyces sp. G5(2025)]|uniref:MFS transporter n=1 Tax=Streptomyces sp. G5(2025) TaxID=3406628 RepID=UPI003C20CBDF
MGNRQTARPSSGLLRERNLRLLFAAEASTVLGSRMTPIALSFAVLESGGGASGVGLVLGAQVAPAMVFLLVGGVFADRWGRRVTMIGSDLTSSMVGLIVVALLLTTGLPIAGFVAFAVLLGITSAFFTPALYGILPELVTGSRLQEANGLRSTINSVGSLLGPALGGALVAFTSPVWAIAIDALTYLLSAWLIFKLRVKQPTHISRPKDESFWRQLRDGWQEFSSRTWLWSLLLYTSLTCTLVLGPVMVLGVVLVGGEGGAHQWGIVMAADGAGAILGGLAGMRLTFRRPLLASVFCTFGLGAFAVMLAVRMPVYVLVAGALLSGAGFALLSILWTSCLQVDVPTETLSRVSAYDGVATVLCMTLGYLWAAPAAAWAGAAQVLWLGAAWTVLSSVVMLAVPVIRRQWPLSKSSEPAERSTLVPSAHENLAS